MTPLPRATSRLFTVPPPIRQRATASLARLARRRWVVRIAKYLLPLCALALLATVALWPEFARMNRDQRVTFHRLTQTDPDSAQVTQARYRSTDTRGRPYTITARLARQVAPDRIDLTGPTADVTSGDHSWVLLEAAQGVFHQHANILDLQGHVQMYRDDGTRIETHAVTIDLRQGAAASNDMVHAQGPFGTLDAQGFTLTGHGQVVQFAGPVRLVLAGGSQ